MPFGLCSASEVLQKRVYQTFGDIDDVHVIADDIIIASNSEEEADHTLIKLFKRAQEKNVKFNIAKLQLKKSEVSYMGNIIGSNGVKPDPSKVEAIVNMREPECKKDIQRLIGMLNYLSQYIPDMSTVTAPMRSLLKVDVPFVWNTEHEHAFNKIKEILSTTPGLRLFDPNLKVQIQCDASKTGIGACLLQEGQPVAYYSKALTPTEMNWFPIEKECLAVVCAAEKFQHYIYGREVEVRSDHKPLDMITRKSIHKASPRIQAMLLRLMKYNLYVSYQPGPTMYIADTLSRAYVESEHESDDIEVDTNMRIHSLVTNLPMSNQRKQKVQCATEEDETMVKLSQTIAGGWPRHRRDCDPLIRQYWPIRDELHIIQGVVYAGERVVIPNSMRSEMLQKLHESHLGMEKCRARARSVMYWPAMSNDINEMIAKCPTCLKYRRENQREPLTPHEVPLLPWQKLGADIFEYGGNAYLLIVDYFSKYPEVCLLQGKSASAVISRFRTVFARHGLPEILIADNMPFNSSEMKTFAAEYGFTIKTSSPEHAASNGQSERMIGTVKQLMRKANEESRDPHLALLAYRNTSVAGMPYSPAELLMSRKLRDNLPTTESLLKPRVAEHAYARLRERQKKAKAYFDRGTKKLSKLDRGDTIRIKSGRTWTPATVTAVHTSPRSYMVTTASGRVYRRNRKWLHKSSEPPPLILMEDAGDDHTDEQYEQHDTPPPHNPEVVQPGLSAECETANSPNNEMSQETMPVRRSCRQKRPPAWLADYEHAETVK